eukprot:scaffold7961_cov115-Isochrysis_galbana.AAC.4
MVHYPNRYGTIDTTPPQRSPHPPRLRDRWESLQVTVVHNTFSDREGSCHFTKEENQSYIDTDLDHHYFQNKKINNERFLATWDVITQHCDTRHDYSPFSSNKRKEAHSPRPG